MTNSGTSANAIGGTMEHNYHYDNLYRLDSASGAFVGANGKKANYSLAMGYDNMHNITHKRQDVVQQSVKFDGILNAGYDLSYTYANNSQQIANIADASYRAERSSGTYATGSVASDSIDHKTHSYRYDANGNLLYVGTGKKINDSTLLESSTRRLLWDEDNRLLAISDNGYVSNYWYDASGERTVKQSGGSEGVFVNGVLSAARTQTSKFTAYVSPYLVVSNGGNYSKHIYVGSQRITSKLSNSLIFNESRNPLSIAKANNSVEPTNPTDYTAKFNTLTGTIAERFDSLGVIYKGTVQSGGLITQGTTSGVTPQYFYHPDHLGSSSLITDENGLMVQHIQYVPFGEVFVEERTTSWSTPYKFNAKELDPETGLYYYHARYYDPRTSVWLSVDPLAEKYPNISSYVYCADNPVKYIDPDGRIIVLAGTKAQMQQTLAALQKLTNDKLTVNYRTGVVKIPTLSTGGNLTSGTALIRELNSKLPGAKTVTIDNQNSEGFFPDGIDYNAAGHLSSPDATNGVGVDAYVSFNPEYNPDIMTENPTTGNAQVTKRPNFIGLGHELIHALHYMTGKKGTGTTTYTYTDAAGNIVTKIEKTEEVNTVGLGGNSKYTENKLRQEQRAAATSPAQQDQLNPRVKY